jgi:hypothetical protein
MLVGVHAKVAWRVCGSASESARGSACESDWERVTERVLKNARECVLNSACESAC